jgi:hypothetical protein
MIQWVQGITGYVTMTTVLQGNPVGVGAENVKSSFSTATVSLEFVQLVEVMTRPDLEPTL